MTPVDVRSALSAYATLFDYPGGEVDAAAARAASLVGRRAGPALERFRAWLERSSPAAREEAHTAAFDLSPTCPPYVGYHLLGDGPTRGPFLARLAGVYAAHRFAVSGELPDHVAVVLRFLAEATGPDRDALLEDGLLPALAKMGEALGAVEGPYRDLVESLQAFASEVAARAAAEAAAGGAREVTA